MTPRNPLTSIVAALTVVAAPALAQTTAPAAAAPENSPTTFSVQQHHCVAPQYPSKERTDHLKADAYNKTIETFNREYTAYGDCVKKYIEDNKALIKATTEATNKAIEEYNKYNAEIKAQVEADKK
jgi:hypothetical protein